MLSSNEYHNLSINFKIKVKVNSATVTCRTNRFVYYGSIRPRSGRIRPNKKLEASQQLQHADMRLLFSASRLISCSG